jgi:hypothetical protein
VSATELPIAATPVATISRERYAELARRVRLLSWASLAIISVEGAVAIASGIVASSIALVGFGLDSVIEGLASLIIVWRFTGSRTFSHAAETRAQKLVAIQFFILASYVAIESTRALIDGAHDRAAASPHRSTARPSWTPAAIHAATRAKSRSRNGGARAQPRRPLPG